MKVEKITDKITLIEKDTQKEIAETFIRFQEHYESPIPELRGKIFTLGQAKNLYSEHYKDGSGAFTYIADWAGFNIPNYVLNPFIQGLFDPLTKEEKEIVELFRYRTDKFYVIGIHSGSFREQTLDHETAHGLWYTDDKYRKAVKSELAKHNLTQMKGVLMDMGYCDDEEILDDECHAYIGCNFNYLENYGIEADDFVKLSRRLQTLFERHK